MPDLFAASAPSGAASTAPRKAPSLHSDTDLYLAVEKLGAWIWLALPHIQRGMKQSFGDTLLYESAEMADFVRLANIAKGEHKLPIFNELLSRLERVRYHLKSANAGGVLPHKTYANSIPITDSIGRQIHGLRSFFAPAPSPVT